MRETKELNIKNQTYYFFNNMTDIKKFQTNLLKIDNNKRHFIRTLIFIILATLRLKKLVTMKIFIA